MPHVYCEAHSSTVRADHPPTGLAGRAGRAGLAGLAGRAGRAALAALAGLHGLPIPRTALASLHAKTFPLVSRHVVPFTGPIQLPELLDHAWPPEIYAIQFMLVSKM